MRWSFDKSELWDKVAITFFIFLSPCRNKHLVSIYPILTFFSQLWVYILLFSELQNCDCEIKSHSYFFIFIFLVEKKAFKVLHKQKWKRAKSSAKLLLTKTNVVFSSLLKDMYYASVKALYTVGYSTSLVSLTTAMVILCRFRSV